MSTPHAPLAAGGISLRMYPHDLPATALIDEMCAQAQLAEAAGFDGLMTSEHHGGFGAYMPNPLQIAGFLLEATDTLWAAPCPLLLPLRHWTQVAEDLAWLAAKHPTRVGAGFAAGGLAQDFELAELPFDENLARFKAALPRIVEALRGQADAPLGEDRALSACASTPLPCVSAAMSPAAARRAASLGIGILCDSLAAPERLAQLALAHSEALGLSASQHAGAAARILIRRAWVGPPPASKVGAQMDFYRSYAAESAQSHWGQDEMVAATSGDEVAERLASVLETSGCEALNLRLHVQGAPPEIVREQIERFGSEVLPALRTRLSR